MNLIDFIKIRIGYEFIDIKLLKLALTHKSFSKNNNERLEFFGDAILSMMISELLINQYPNHNEGQLSLFRASIDRFILESISSRTKSGVKSPLSLVITYSFPDIVVPTRSPVSIRDKFPLLKMLNTFIGNLLSIHNDIAVESII